MDSLNLLERKILNALNNHPLDSFSSLSKRMGMSKQMFIRKFNSLCERNITKKATATFTPEALSLTRYHVIFKVANIAQMTNLQVAFREHPYTRHYNQFYGESFGCYTIFDVPQKCNGLLFKFFDYLVEQEICEEYSVYRSLGYRHENPEPFPSYTQDPKPFDIGNFISKRLEKPTRFPRRKTPLNLENITPLHLILIRDIGRNVRTPQAELIERYKKFITKPPQNANDYLPQPFLTYLESFFANRSNEAIKVAFGKQYNFVKDNIIYAPRWSFERRFYESYVYRAFFIENVSSEEGAQLYYLVKEENPPFNVLINVLDNGVVLNIKLPTYYDANFNYLIWSTYSDYKLYSLDFFGRRGIYYHFYVDNFNTIDSAWRNDEEWILNSVIYRIEERIKNGQCGVYNNGPLVTT